MPLNDMLNLAPPAAFKALQEDTERAGFMLACEPKTGAILRTLAASKPGGRLLEIGTGTGVGSCWILDGMDSESRLTTVDKDTTVSSIARRHLGGDKRIEFVTADAEVFLQNVGVEQFDFIFADTFPGKFMLLDKALAALKIGGLYVIDDLLPQPGWDDNHQENVDRLIAGLENRPDLILTKMNWASGLIIATRIKGTA